MSNLTKYLVIVGILIAIGAMLLIFGSQTITGDLVIEEGKVNSLTQLEIKTELDPEINTEGVYAVQTIEGKEYDISAVVIDSTDSKIRDVSINRNSFEDNFVIEQAGTYTLIITTSESEEIPLVGSIYLLDGLISNAIELIVKSLFLKSSKIVFASQEAKSKAKLG